ncbi:MAG: hypothetical protein ACO1TE_05685 [Prosthecobacter sp.]
MNHDTNTSTTNSTLSGKAGAVLLILALLTASAFLFRDLWGDDEALLQPAADQAIAVIFEPGPDLAPSAPQAQPLAALLQYLQTHHQRHDKTYTIWCAENTPDGSCAAGAAPAVSLHTPALDDGGSLLMPEKLQAFWATFGSVLAELARSQPQPEPPAAPQRPVVVEQIRAVVKERGRHGHPAPAQDHTLIIVSTMEDAEIFTDSATATAAVLPPDTDAGLLENTHVCVWQLTPQERNPAHLKQFWTAWMKRCGAKSVDWVHTAREPRFPMDRVTALVLDGSDTLQEKDLLGLTDLLVTTTRAGELVQIYSIDPQNAGHFLTPREITRGDDEAGFRDAAMEHIQRAGIARGTEQSPIIEFLQEVSRNARFSMAAARQTCADFPEKAQRQIILVTDLEQNVHGSSLDLTTAPPWWRRSGIWEKFMEDSHYDWAATRSSLKDITFYVRQVRRPKESGKDVAALRSFWTSLLEDAGASIKRWDLEQ